MLKCSLLLLILAATTFIPRPSEAGCGINLGVTNNHDSSISVYNYIQSSVKIKGLTWHDLHNGNWGGVGKKKWSVAPGRAYRDNYQADFGCNKKRRYKIYHYCGSSRGSRVTYYPSANGWTKSQRITINLQCN